MFKKLFLSTMLAAVPCSAYSALDERSALETLFQFEHHMETHKDLLKVAEGRDIVLLIGRTGAGKSTLANLIAKVPLTVGNRYGRAIFEIADEKDHPQAFPIGHGGESETFLPSCQDIEGEFLIFDVAGLSDTRGTAHTLISSILLKHVVEIAKSVRLVFVTSRGEMDAGRGAFLKELIASAQSLLPGQDVVCGSSLILTKTPQDYDLESQVNYLKVLTQGHKTVLQWSNEGKIAIFSEPKTEANNIQEACEADRLNILETIKKATAQKIDSFDVSSIYSAVEVSEISSLLIKRLKRIAETVDENLSVAQKNSVEFFEGSYFTAWETQVAEDTFCSLLKPIADELYAQAYTDISGQIRLKSAEQAAQLRAQLEKKRREEQERLRILAEQRRAEEERQRILAEQRRAEEERQRILAEQREREERQQRIAAEQKRAEEERQRRVAEQARAEAEARARRNDPTNWPLRTEQREKTIEERGPECQSPHRTATRRIGHGLSRRTSYGWPVFQDVFTVRIIEERTLAIHPDDSRQVIERVGWHVTSRVSTKTGTVHVKDVF